MPIQFKHVVILCLSLLAFECSSLGQTKGKTDPLVWNGNSMVPMSSLPVDTILFDLTIDLAKQILPLDSVLGYAVRYSPELLFEDASIEKYKFNTKYTRYLWMNGVTGFANYTYGNQTNLNTINSDGNVLNNSLGIGYRFGANINLPLTEVFGRPHRMRQMKTEEKMAKYKRSDVEIELKRKVISDYFNLVSSQKIMHVRQSDVESALLTVEIANVEMRRGKIHPSELSRLKNILAIAETNLEMSRRDLMIYYYQLETMVGVKLNTLRR